MSRRVYALFYGDMPVINAWDYNRARLAVWLSDRKANGEAFPAERIRCCLSMAEYNRLLAGRGLPTVSVGAR